ncbi:hypothetical protein [uncultured Winogradskyella sp.]|uniref:hypothetical protein n=1 Tax=uncultured Winogradskyella sp. TaxID=395353 RepID=UPI002637BB13|nr:hypothetical protein [uncultured Winogradskyella sp.]
MKSIENFKDEQFVCSNIFGSWDGIHGTPGGTFQGMEYSSDVFIDKNGDGKWGSGESVIMHFCDPPTVQQG